MSIRRIEKMNYLEPIVNVFVSVSDKSDLDRLVLELVKECRGIHFYAPSGTHAFIQTTLINEWLKNKQDVASIPLTEVSDYTGQPEIAGGLVKTLHHKLFLGYLTETYCANHQDALKANDAVPIDLVIVDVYPFEKVVEKEGTDIEDARGNIDVGGPCALRAAGKNFLRVMTVPSPKYYDELINGIRGNHGCTSLETRFKGAQNTWDILTDYDYAIYTFLTLTYPSDLHKTYASAIAADKS